MKTKKLLRYTLIAVVVLIVLAVVGKKVGWFGKEEVIQVAVEKAKRRDIVETITANGKVQPETEVIISPDVSGEIVDLQGQRRRYGQPGPITGPHQTRSLHFCPGPFSGFAKFVQSQFLPGRSTIYPEGTGL